jgi:Fe-S-cluster containining protein
MADPINEVPCIRCGECCTDEIFFDIGFLKKFKPKFQKRIKSAFHSPDLDKLAIVTDDEKCIFLCYDDTCAIYSHRPDICRCFGDPRYFECPVISLDGEIRPKEEYERIKAKNTDPEQFTEEFKVLMNRINLNQAKYLTRKSKTR